MLREVASAPTSGSVVGVKTAPTVVAVLRRYADRGLFRGFGEREVSPGCLELRFTWHAPWPHILVADARRGTLVLRDLLPEVPYRSEMDVALRRFLVARSAADVPEHRRIDPKRVRVRARNRGGTVSIELAATPGQLPYAAEKAVKLLNEIFLSFLAGPYDAYMVRVFGAPEE
jgi:hypothetical protein